MMNKRDRLLSLFLATVGGLSIASSIVSSSPAMAGQKPECYKIDESGQLIDLSSPCNSSSQIKKANTERSTSIMSSVVEQPLSEIDYTASIPLVYTNPLPVGLSLGSASSVPFVFAGSVPVAYESFANAVYTSPTFWVRNFQETASSRSRSFRELSTLVNLYNRENHSFLFIDTNS